MDQTLRRLRVPPSACDDLRQDVLFMTWALAFRGRIRWYHRPSLRAFLRVVTTRAVNAWWLANLIFDELHEADAVNRA